MSRNSKRRGANGNGNGKSAHLPNEQTVPEEKPGKKIIVLDTSVLIHDPEALDILRQDGNTVLIIPWVVLEELDQLKSKPNVGPDAREAIRRIEDLSQNGDESFRIVEIPTSKYFKELQKTKADHQIIATARALQATSDHESEVVLMSMDTIVRVIGRELGINTEDYPYDQVDQTFSTELQELHLYEGDDIFPLSSDEEFSCKDHGLEINCNDGVLCWSHEGDSENWGPKFAAIYKGEDSFRAIALNKKVFGLEPYSLENGNGNGQRNWSQYVAMAQLLDPKIKLVFLQGSAGTGKTLIAMASGLEQKRNYHHILVARPAVHLDDQDTLGFLPGDINAKLAPWMGPIEQALFFLQGLNDKNWKFIERMKGTKEDTGKNDKKLDEPQKEERESIIIKSLDYIRGETFHNYYIVVDEAQNLTPHQIRTIITRVGNNTKMVFTGDLGQIDRSRRLDRKTSGLAYAMSKMANHPLVAIVNFKEPVRSELVKLAEERGL